MKMTGGRPLVGREDELRRLEVFISELAQGPCAMVVTGDPGIGKTVLWRVALDMAQGSGTEVLFTRCAEAELPLAFGGLADLLDDAVHDIESQLSEPQRRLIAVALGREDPDDSLPDAIALPRAVTTSLRILGDRGPTLIAIDDVPWLDPASRRVLGFAIRRLGDARIGVLVTRREREVDPLGLSRALDSVQELEVGPLSIDSIRQLVRYRFPGALSRSAMARVYEASGGNPLFALEFAGASAEQGISTLADGGPLPLPPSLEVLVGERIARLPEGVRGLLAVISAVERPTTSLLRQIMEDDFEALLDAAVSSHAVVLDGDGLVRLRHPLLASAAYSALKPSSRRAMHTQIASVMASIEARGRHMSLAQDEPNATAADLLDTSAAAAAGRGAPDAAAELARRAVELTPSTDLQRREERVLAVAEYLCDAREMGRAAAWIDGILADGVSGRARVRALLLRFEAEHNVEERGRLVAEALEHVGDDPALRVRALLAASLHWRNSGDMIASEAMATQALTAAEGTRDPILIATSLSTLAARMRSPDLELLDRATALCDIHGTLPRSTPPRVVHGEALLFVQGEVTRARPILEGELERLRRQGREHERHRVTVDLGYVELLAGNWDAAERNFQEAFEISVDRGDQLEVAQLAEPLARLAAYRGEVDEARRLASIAVSYGELHWTAISEVSKWVLGLLELALDNPEGACDYLRDVSQRIDVDWAVLDIPEAIEALIAVGRRDDAEAILTRFEERWVDNHWAVHAALRCRGMILLSRGEAEAALKAAENAASGFEADGCPFDRGRSLLLAGEVLRRQGERRLAAKRLEQAREIFADLGAALWLDRTVRELSLASPRPRSDRDLTKAEQAVAELVALGHTNREVAARLFIKVPTVEAHLTRIYRKVGIRSRTQLARRVADGDLPLGADSKR